MKNVFLPAWLISGVLVGLAHPLCLDVPTGFLMWFGFVPLLLGLRSGLSFRGYLIRTYLFSLTEVCFSGFFVAYSGFLNFVVSNLSQSVLVMMGFLVHWFFLKQFGWRRSLLALPFIWTVAEWVKHVLPHDFQVCPIAYSQVSVLWFAQMADILGVWGISFWLVLVNVSVALTVDSMGKWKMESGKWETVSHGVGNSLVFISCRLFFRKWGIQGIMLFGLPLFYAWWSYINLPNGRTVEVALVQTNEDSYAKLDSIGFNQRIDRVIHLANEAAKGQPDLIVLPESAIPVPILQNPLAFKMVRYYVDSWNAALVVGFVDYPDSTNRKRLYNSAMVFTPQLAREWDSLGAVISDLKVYRKQNPMPVMEYMPYVDWLGWDHVLGLNGMTVLKGDEAHVFSFADHFENEVKTSATICWEQMFPETQAGLTEKGAQFLCQMNNDGWFGQSVGPALLLNMNRMRAIENRRSIARASNTGISTFIDAFEIGRAHV